MVPENQRFLDPSKEVRDRRVIEHSTGHATEYCRTGGVFLNFHW